MAAMTLSAKRQVGLPADLCQQMALKPGAKIDVSLAADGSGILMRPAAGAQRKPATDRAAAVHRAIQWYRRGMDFSDALHLAQSGLCKRQATLDARFAKMAHRLGLQPAVVSPA